MLEHPHRVIPGRDDIQRLRLLETCSFRWIFDEETRRFRRTPREARVWFESPEMWTEYHRLEIDDSRSWFVLELDAAGTQILRAWLHSDPCELCGRGRDGGYRLQSLGGGHRPEGA